MYLVTGGDFDNWHTETWDVLDSTEIFDPMVGRWVASGAKLPQQMTELRAVNIDDRVLIFGKMTILNPYSKSEPKSFCGPQMSI